MRRWSVLIAVASLALSGGVGATTLNKCIDASGGVTYSNLPCRNAQESEKIEVDPAPLTESVPAQSSRASSMKSQPPLQQRAQPSPEPQRAAKPSAPSKPAARATAGKCDALSEKLGNVLDKMDTAHRKGYTQEQMDQWNKEVKELERTKQQSGCF